ncbi:MAG TPA: HEPN domain-containing protein [Verrucomicrobiae bacterium]|nr:HEPN domain-containing protein [Verrucomicrobiae bacterium]
MTGEPGVSVADEWLRIARKDWRRAERNLEDRDPEAAGFFLQQSLEKYLKAFLLKRHWKLRKIHELDALLDEAPNSRRTWKITGTSASAFPVTTWPSVIRH